MIFNTYWFVGFAAVFYPIYWLLWRPGPRLAWLLAGCAVFHAHFAGAAGVLPIIVLGLVTYLVALSRRRLLCGAGIVLCVLALAFYKYAGFLCRDVFGALAPGLAGRLEPAHGGFAAIAVPLAISFFAFEFVHYLADIRRGHEPIRRPAEFALFALHFPSLVAGPIKRYESYVPDLHAGLARVNVDDVAAGLQRVALGLVKKVVLADNLALALDFYGARYADLSPEEAWLYLVALSARLLLDFSGYSDLAIGLSRMLGVRLPENFNFPYLATSLQDFWRRWHISLSSWVRDYVYIPLGGSRHGPLRRLVNGLAAFALVGLWHGAAWHFVLWGLWHGAGLAVSSTYTAWLGPAGAKLKAELTRAPSVAWALTMLHVSFGWLLFFHEPAQAWAMATKLMGVFL
jgi:alginate O-acetyltransferase complex protein AlgI